MIYIVCVNNLATFNTSFNYYSQKFHIVYITVVENRGPQAMGASH